jgi:hypothetical protein
MKKLIIAVGLLFLSVSILFAQSLPRVSGYIFEPGWYVGGNIGPNYFLGEGAGSLVKTISLRPLGMMGRASMGYNFTPLWGVRGMFGASQHNSVYADVVTSFGSENLTLDATLNLSNLKAFYNLYRPADFSLFAGLGVAYRNQINDTQLGIIDPAIFPVFRGGLQLDYHITQVIDFNVMGELNMMSDNFNGNVSGVPVDMYPAVTIGISYHFWEGKLKNSLKTSKK